WLRFDRRHHLDARRAAWPAVRGGQSAGAHVAVQPGAGAVADPGRACADDRGRARHEEFRLMAHINLLPWRAERRKVRQREFFMQLGAAALAAVGVMFLWWFWMD